MDNINNISKNSSKSNNGTVLGKHSSDDLVGDAGETVNVKNKCRKRLDVKTVNFRAESKKYLEKVTNIGHLFKKAKQHIFQYGKSSFECNVNLHCCPVKIHSRNKPFSFVLFVDPTGFVSLGGKYTIFQELAQNFILDDLKLNENVGSSDNDANNKINFLTVSIFCNIIL